ncbi:MAG: PepSY domain-containing protein [Rhodobacterales bacterium]|nr:PepSY domain-containing protein [Rhodobacterales bacterium]
MTFKPLFAALAVAFTLTGTLAHAADEASLTDAKKAEITTLLVAQGYEIRSIQIEDGMYEVYAIKYGATAELYLDDNLNIVKGGEES